MIAFRPFACRKRFRFAPVITIGAIAACIATSAQEFQPGNLVVSRSVYKGHAETVKPGEVLPPGCTGSLCAGTTGAIADGTYPYVFNNDGYDGSFGITSPIYLDEITPLGAVVRTLQVPNNLLEEVGQDSNQMVTSFSSKSELALHLSTDANYLTFMGYVAPVNAIDVSNSNTPGAVDPTNPVGESYYRAVATVDQHGKFAFIETNAYSGNNGRAVILSNSNGAESFYTAGNAGNGANPQPDGVILGAGAQIIIPATVGEYQQNPRKPTPVASFNVTELGAKADKIGKDDNFRGLTIFNHVLYYTKGSGSNGVNTVYFVDTTGTACPNGVGLPAPGAALPATPLTYDPGALQTVGLPDNMCILAGFPSKPNKTVTVTAYPFSLWFADANTLYVADEGDGTNAYDNATNLYTDAAMQTTAGLEKWVFDSSSSTWKLAYTLQNGLKLGVPYAVKGLPSANNAATGLPWTPATDGLRNFTGMVTDDRKAVIWAISSTVSGNGDQGADPNKLYMIVDDLKNTSASDAANERFWEVRRAGYKEVLRGISLAPGAHQRSDD
ncbi:MAG TPA: hypothetical protein VGG62_04320 [Terracidiphilus sp.]